jgi:hypothetical protein
LYHLGLGVPTTGVELVHGCLDSRIEPAFDGVGGAIQHFLQHLPLVTGKITQNVLNHRIPGTFSRTADANPQPGEILSAQASNDGLEAVVPPGTATSSKTYPAQGKVQVIANHQNIFQVYTVLFAESGYRLSTQIHISLRPGYHNLISSYLTGADPRMRLPQGDGNVMPPSEALGTHEAHVVTVVDIVTVRVPQTNNEFNQSSAKRDSIPLGSLLRNERHFLREGLRPSQRPGGFRSSGFHPLDSLKEGNNTIFEKGYSPLNSSEFFFRRPGRR